VYAFSALSARGEVSNSTGREAQSRFFAALRMTLPQVILNEVKDLSKKTTGVELFPCKSAANP
jgi:hypothetical protein